MSCTPLSSLWGLPFHKPLLAGVSTPSSKAGDAELGVDVDVELGVFPTKPGSGVASSGGER